jgi:hypothetical protein
VIEAAVLTVLVVLPTWIATIRQTNEWPFGSYPMFSKSFHKKRLTVYRIAYEDKSGRLIWWKPHYYKLSSIFGGEVKRCLKMPAPDRDEALDKVFGSIEHCLIDDPSAVNALSVCVVMRQSRQDGNGNWQLLNATIVRRPITKTVDAPR